MPIIGVPEVPVTFPFGQKNIRILDLDPRSEAYCLSPYSVCSKRLPMEEAFLSLEIRTRY
ncbi:ANM_collapsed_G0054400.mRNA.1.CDS.1 [Saccharomyces cerevisiae]|nr:ANM_collapsed_G0054400.mRNA.1.CDS.1 [Saccharomyces cerevisiae]